ncbi:MAG: tetratricopeptide repeat protein [Sedimentisphaerales bacterium]|jgi:tetratricopeptide (TPR) repeat protein
MSNKLAKYGSFWICLALTLATAAVYFQVRSYDFVNYDDGEYVYENPNIQRGFTCDAVKWAVTTVCAANWHPLTWISHILDWQLYGSNAGGHHITNLIFHIANTLLLFLVLKRMTSATWPSAFVAALFALHPLHVESVAWVSERKDVLSTFFWMLTMWAYLQYIKHPGKARYILTLLMFSLGLLSKPMLVTLPFVLLLLDYWPLERFGKLRFYHLILEKIPFVFLTAISSIVTFLVQRSGGAVSQIANLGLTTRISNAFISYVKYIEKMFWPAGLAYFYPHPGRNISILYAVVSAFFLLAVTFFILRFSSKHRYLLTGWFWYLGTLVPVIGLIQVGDQAMADRYSYITLTGLFIIIAWGASEILFKWQYRKFILAASSLIILLILAICSYVQAGYWKDSLSLYTHTLKVSNYNYKAHFNMAVTLRDMDKYDEAAVEFQKCLQIKPDAALAINGLGIIFGRQGKFAEAGEYFMKALNINPNLAEARTNLGYVLINQDKLDDAMVNLNESLRLNPDSALTHYYLGQVLERKSKIDQAVSHYEEALRLKPYWFELMNELAWILASSDKVAVRNPEKAVKLARGACELTEYKRPEFLDTLAVAYAAAGKFSKAIEVTGKALELCQTSDQDTLKKKLESRLILYKAGKPYIENEQ